jgi:hypothetical protein
MQGFKEPAERVFLLEMGKAGGIVTLSVAERHQASLGGNPPRKRERRVSSCLEKA